MRFIFEWTLPSHDTREGKVFQQEHALFHFDSRLQEANIITCTMLVKRFNMDFIWKIIKTSLCYKRMKRRFWTPLLLILFHGQRNRGKERGVQKSNLGDRCGESLHAILSSFIIAKVPGDRHWIYEVIEFWLTAGGVWRLCEGNGLSSDWGLRWAGSKMNFLAHLRVFGSI